MIGSDVDLHTLLVFVRLSLMQVLTNVCYDLDNSNFATSNNHVGMYLERTGPTTFRTIEGNVDDTCKQMDRSMTTAPRIVFVRPSR